jgi:hypothetical protein
VPADALFDPGQRLGKGLSLDLQMHQRLGLSRLVVILGHQAHQMPALVTLDAHDRMHYQLHRNPKVGQRKHHGIDQERHVIVDDLDDRARRGPAVLIPVRIVDTQVDLAGNTTPGKLQVLGSHYRQIADLHLLELGQRHALQHASGKLRCQLILAGRISNTL